MMRVIAIAATVVMCAACAGQDQQSDGVGAPKATPAGIVDKLNKEINAALTDPKPIPAAQVTDANVVGDPQPVTTAQVTDANVVGDPEPVPNTLCARIAAAATNFELQCKPKDGSE
jgi:hypothetical protein